MVRHRRKTLQQDKTLSDLNGHKQAIVVFWFRNIATESDTGRLPLDHAQGSA